MQAKTFSKKEAIKRGIEMTKKYFGVIFIMMIIYTVFELVEGQLKNNAGEGYLSKGNIELKLYKSSESADNFNKYLIDEGYINKLGQVQEKLNSLASAADLNLPSNLEGDRDKIFNFLQTYRYRLPFPKAVYYVFMVAFWIVSMLMSIGFFKISLMLSRDERPDVWELFSNTSFLLTYILSVICYALAVIGGFVLLIVPGFIFMIALGMSAFFIVDQNMGPIESLKASRVLTKGVRWQLFCFGGLIFLFNCAGALCLLIGLMFTIPAGVIATAYVYDQLRKQNEVPGLAVN